MTDVKSDDMQSMVRNFPNLLTMVSINQEIRDICEQLQNKGVEGIVIQGMGGSAIAGLYVQALLRDLSSVPIITNQEYTLPAYVDSSWITIAVSYSGNTEETLAAYDNATQRKSPILTVASGGQLLSSNSSAGKIEIPSGYQPRAAFPILFSTTLNLVECLLASDLTQFENLGKSLAEKMVKWDESSLTPSVMAQDFADYVPVFIGASHLSPVAYRAKCQINENAKTMAFYSEIPEANHNEIESFGGDNEFSILPVFLRSSFEDERTSKRLNITTTLYEEEGYTPIRLSIRSADRIEEMLSLTLYLDLVSVELANIREVDTVSVGQISRLKKELG